MSLRRNSPQKPRNCTNAASPCSRPRQQTEDCNPATQRALDERPLRRPRRINNAPASGESLVKTVPMKNRTCARSTRVYDTLTALGRYARELFNRRYTRVERGQTMFSTMRANNVRACVLTSRTPTLNVIFKPNAAPEVRDEECSFAQPFLCRHRVRCPGGSHKESGALACVTNLHSLAMLRCVMHWRSARCACNRAIVLNCRTRIFHEISTCWCRRRGSVRGELRETITRAVSHTEANALQDHMPNSPDSFL